MPVPPPAMAVGLALVAPGIGAAVVGAAMAGGLAGIESLPPALTPAAAGAAVCERNDNSKIRPATVPPRARTARRIEAPIVV
jgi:hypothetical protein